MIINNKTSFNKYFKLTINGKYKGIDSLGSEHNIALFFHKLNRKIASVSSHSKPMDDVAVIKVAGMVCKVYAW